jgi:hypothetical protein
MRLKIIQRDALNEEKWNALVNRTENASFFSNSWYLDALAENWCVLVDDSYKTGVALPYTLRMGQRILYTPIFVSYMELLGEKSMMNLDELRTQILAEFKVIEIEFKEPVLGAEEEKFICQVLGKSNNRKPQVQRMLNKARKNDLTIHLSDNWRGILEVIKIQLKHKFSGMSDASMERLEKTYLAAAQIGTLRAFEIRKGEICQGGIICFENKDHVFYSKGAALEDARDNGGLYAAIDAAITTAFESDKWFDFGGSRVAGVRKFNRNFGGTDFEYFSYRIDNGPFWFRTLRGIKNKWFKKS